MHVVSALPLRLSPDMRRQELLEGVGDGRGVYLFSVITLLCSLLSMKCLLFKFSEDSLDKAMDIQW